MSSQRCVNYGRHVKDVASGHISDHTDQKPSNIPLVATQPIFLQGWTKWRLVRHIFTEGLEGTAQGFVPTTTLRVEVARRVAVGAP